MSRGRSCGYGFFNRVSSAKFFKCIEQSCQVGVLAGLLSREQGFCGIDFLNASVDDDGAVEGAQAKISLAEPREVPRSDNPARPL
jgi:hypothetical protein